MQTFIPQVVEPQPLPEKKRRKPKRKPSELDRIRQAQTAKQRSLDFKERRLTEQEAALEVERAELERKQKQLQELMQSITKSALAGVADSPPEVRNWREVEIVDSLARRSLDMAAKGGGAGDGPRPLINLQVMEAPSDHAAKRVQGKTLS